MSELTPCPECQRHVRKTETSCPFCGEALSLSQLPAHLVPRSRLGRAATFAFGATLAGAALVGCGGESEGKKEGEGGTASGGSAAPAAGTNNDSGGASSVAGAGLIYGAPPVAGTSNDSSGASGGVGDAPAAGSGNFGGNPGVPPK